MTGRAPRILILTASYGSGHNRVAAALRQALSAEGAEVEVIDHFARFVDLRFALVTQTLYLAILKAAPALWGFAYRLADRLPVESPLLFGMNRLGAAKLARHLARHPADLVISTHPTPAGALSRLCGRGRIACPHATVFTDFVAHTQWVYPHVERYFVPAEEVQARLLERGIPSDRIRVSGIPLQPAFASPVDRSALRAELGLLAELPVVLVMAGLHGTLGGLGEVVRVLTALPLAVQALVVCGQDRGLARRLERLIRGDPRVRVYGYVEGIHQLMGGADLLVSKAGAVTMAEALALELPAVLFRSLPGQERANEAFLEAAGVALVARSRQELAEQVVHCLIDPALRLKLAENIQRLRRPDAARTVARELLVLSRGG